MVKRTAALGSKPAVPGKTRKNVLPANNLIQGKISKQNFGKEQFEK